MGSCRRPDAEHTQPFRREHVIDISRQGNLEEVPDYVSQGRSNSLPSMYGGDCSKRTGIVLRNVSSFSNLECDSTCPSTRWLYWDSSESRVHISLGQHLADSHAGASKATFALNRAGICPTRSTNIDADRANASSVSCFSFSVGSTKPLTLFCLRA